MKKEIQKTTYLSTHSCYSCGKECDDSLKLRVIESPKDEFGIEVPFCERCYWDAQEDIL